MNKKLSINNIISINFKSHSANIIYKKDLINDSFSLTNIDNTFITFSSKDNNSYIIYTKRDKSINCFDYNKEKVIKEVKSAHYRNIMSFRYLNDQNNNKEYIVSVSMDKNIKLWEFPNLFCIASIEKAHRCSFIFSLCMLSFKKNMNFILSSSGSDEENVKVWDFNGQKNKEITNSKERTGFIDTYYSSEYDIYYVIIANYGNIKSYNFASNELYKIYQDKSDEKNDHSNFIIFERINNDIILIDSCYDGYIRLWDFHNEFSLKKIKCNGLLRNICLSGDKKYLFMVCIDNNKNYIKIIELNHYKIISCIESKDNTLLSVKSIKHNLFGDCLLTKGTLDENIKLWVSFQ